MWQDATARPRTGGRPAPTIAWLTALFALFAIVALTLLPGTTRAQESCPANLAPGDSCQAGREDAGTAPGAGLPSTSVGNPIDLVTGTKSQSETDLAIDGAALGFRRHYQSVDTDDTIGIGQGWRHTYAVTLAATPDGGRRLTDATGRVVLFGPTSEERPGIHPGYLPSDGHVLDAPTGSTWVVPDGRRLSFRGPRLVRIDWPDRRFIALAHDGEQDGRLASATDETGRTLRFEWTPGRIDLPGYEAVPFMPHPGHLAALILPDGQRIEYDYDNRRNLTRARFPDATSRVYRYEDEVYRHHLTGLVDRTGTAFASWRYDDDGLAIASGHADGVERVTLAYARPAGVGEIGRTRVTDSLGGQSVYTWRRDAATGAGLLLEATGPGCATCPPTGRRYRYDGARLAALVELDHAERPAVTRTFTHDDRARLVRIDETRLDAAGASVTRMLERREYDGDSHRLAVRATPSVAGPGEHVRTTRFDAAGLPVELTERGFAPEVDLATADTTGAAPIERTTRLRWSEGLLREIDGPRDDVDDTTRFEHDASHRLVAIHPPASPAIRLQDHDAHGRPNTLRIGERSPWQLERDAEGRVVRVRQGGQSVRYAHDAEGRLVSITDQDGRSVRVAHDAAGRAVRITDDLGRVTTRVHDTESRVVERASSGIDGSVIRSLAYLFDANGRLSRSTEQRLDANGQPLPERTLAHEGDAIGQLTRAIDPITGVGVSVELDMVARLATVSTAGRTRTTVAFDAAGRDIALSDARGNTTRYPSDDFGRIVMLDSPDSGRVRYRHDAAGNRTREQRSDGGSISYRHDAANRLIERASDDGTARWAWNEGTGTLVSVTNASTTERFTHDGEARLIRHERDLGGRTFVTGYAHDARSRLLDKTLPDGQRLRHHYHDSGPNRGRLRAITRSRWLGLADETLVGEIDQDGRDGDAGYLSAGGVRTRHTLAPNGQQTGFAVSGALELEYTFDANGRIGGIVENGAASRYGYTAGRLTSISTPPGDTRYRYDATGNRIARLHGNAGGESNALTYRYDEGSNRLLETRDGASGASTRYRYDGAGAPLTVGALDYTYDADRRPVAVHRDGELVATYAYSPFGERIRKTVHAGPGTAPRTTRFLYDGQALSAEIDETGTVTAQYVYLDGHRAVAKLAGKRVFGIHGDRLGTPRLMSDADGRIVWRASHTPFGEATVEVDDEPLALRFPGQYADEETGTHYNYFRDYDPATGRYLTSDPIGLAGSINTYGYVGADPLAAVDPLGLFEPPAAGTALHRALVQAGFFAAADGPAPFGDLVGASILLVHFVDAAVGGLTESLFGQTDFTDEYRALFQQIQRFDPVYGSHSPLFWTPDYNTIQRMVKDLYEAQLNYLRLCTLPGATIDGGLREEALQAVEFEEELQAAIERERGPMETWLDEQFDHYRANGGDIDSQAEWIRQGRPEGPALANTGLDPVWLLKHNTQVGKYVNGREVWGAHNADSFQQSLDQIDGVVHSREEIVPGIYQIGYRIPKMERDGVTVIPGEYRKNLGTKTIYDPATYTDAIIVKMSMVAARSAVFQSGSRETSVTVNGVPFRVYIDLNTGKITNVHVARYNIR